jgi:hypothetical protein
VLGVGPPVQAVFVALFHDEIEGRTTIGIKGVLVKITGQPLTFFQAAFQVGRTPVHFFP